jgi:hypothetical protein
MTISSTANKAILYGNGVATSFPYKFLIPNQSQMSVIVTDPSGNQMPLSASQYSVSGIGSKNGGAVTYPLAGAPLPALWSVTILRTLPIVQQTDIVNQNGFYPDVLEAAMDYQTMTQQQLSESQSRGIAFPVVDDQTAINPVLPAAAARSTKPLIFDENGNVTTGQQAYQEPQALLDLAKAVAELLVAGVAPGSGTGMFLQNGVGAIPRPFQSKQRDFLSVTDYGDVGNEVDASDALLTTIAAALGFTYGGTQRPPAIYFPRGEYLLSAQAVAALNGLDGFGIAQYSSLRIYGDGSGSSILRATTATPALLKLSKGIFNLYGIQIDCNHLSGGLQLGGAQNATVGSSEIAYQSSIRDVRIVNQATGTIGCNFNFVYDTDIDGLQIVNGDANSVSLQISQNVVDGTNQILFKRLHVESYQSNIRGIYIVSDRVTTARENHTIEFVQPHVEVTPDSECIVISKSRNVMLTNPSLNQNTGPAVPGASVKNAVVFDNARGTKVYGGEINLPTTSVSDGVTPTNRLISFVGDAQFNLLDRVFLSPYASDSISSCWGGTGFTDPSFQSNEFRNCEILTFDRVAKSTQRWIGDSAAARFGVSAEVSNGQGRLKLGFNNSTTSAAAVSRPNTMNVTQGGFISSDARASGITDGAAFTIDTYNGSFSSGAIFIGVDGAAGGVLLTFFGNTLYAVGTLPAGVVINSNSPSLGQYSVSRAGTALTVTNHLGGTAGFYWLKVGPTD